MLSVDDLGALDRHPLHIHPGLGSWESGFKRYMELIWGTGNRYAISQGNRTFWQETQAYVR